MKVNDKLIQKFFAGQCTAAEAFAVSELLENPEIRKQYLNEEEWENFEVTNPAPKEVSDRIYVDILNEILIEKNIRVSRLKYFAYAASIAIVSFLGWFVYQNNAGQLEDKKAKIEIQNIQQEYKILTNTSVSVKKYTLPDGTLVELNPKSELRFLPFDQEKRDVKLTGEGLFYVHKDKSKPFTVYANDLATTALGTIFRIRAFKNENLIKVKLIEGKVVVKPQNKLLANGIKTVYLTPGKSLIVNSDTYLAEVINHKQAKPKVIESINTNGAIITESAIVFDNEPLAGVFNTLETKLNIKIKYTANQINKMVFTGQYEFGRDDTDSFLTMLCSLNNLIAEKTEDGYIIKRK